MTRLQDLLGPLRQLEHIAPPGPSYAAWERFLEDCRAEGVAALLPDSSGQSAPLFATPLGYALLRRYRWLEESQRLGMPYQEAERAFTAAIERDSAALAEAEHERQRRLARAMRERDKRRPADDADEIFARVDKLGL